MSSFQNSEANLCSFLTEYINFFSIFASGGLGIKGSEQQGVGASTGVKASIHRLKLSLGFHLHLELTNYSVPYGPYNSLYPVSGCFICSYLCIWHSFCLGILFLLYWPSKHSPISPGWNLTWQPKQKWMLLPLHDLCALQESYLCASNTLLHLFISLCSTNCML